jgi:hypothetical protein
MRIVGAAAAGYASGGYFTIVERNQPEVVLSAAA